MVTNDRQLAGRVRVLREHGQRRKYVHDVVGYTARLDTIQAVALLRKLPRLDVWNEERRAAARFYEQHLGGIGDLILPRVLPESEPVWHLYVVRTDGIRTDCRLPRRAWDRNGAPLPAAAASRAGVPATRPPGGSLHRRERLASEVLSLPMFPGIREEQQAAVVAAVVDYFQGG